MAIPRTLRKRNASYLDGQLIIAMPAMVDKRFQRSVIYMCAHSEEGAMGLIINQPASHISFLELLEQLQIDATGRDTDPDDIRVHVGGPVETGRGFVLHSSDYFANESTLAIDEHVSLTATVDILKAMARGRGPERALLALGYAGWSAGQLEREIHANGWLHCPADARLVFDTELDEKYHEAMSRIGIDPTHLVSEAGHA
jgi:putative transcriptional regulator